jgi:Na+-translocating ferredoxin:NAD+ oxidoreductase subunit A
MSDFLIILISAAVVNNIIVLEMVGADPALAFLRRIDVALGLSVTVCILLPSITLICYLLETLLLIPLQIEYLRLIIFVSAIILVLWCFKILGKHSNIKFIRILNVFLPFAGFNTTILGTVLLNQKLVNGFFQALAFSTGSALGFALVLLMLTTINARIEESDVPRSIQGIPVLLITLALISMAFSGLTGMFAG